MHALGSSLKRNLIDQSKVKILNKYDFQLASQSHDAKNRHVSRLAQLVHHLVGQLIEELHERQGVEDQNLKRSF